jgi:hypothetical protein
LVYSGKSENKKDENWYPHDETETSISIINPTETKLPILGPRYFDLGYVVVLATWR